MVGILNVFRLCYIPFYKITVLTSVELPFIIVFSRLKTSIPSTFSAVFWTRQKRIPFYFLTFLNFTLPINSICNCLFVSDGVCYVFLFFYSDIFCRFARYCKKV